MSEIDTPWIAADRGDYGDFDGECVVVLDGEMTRRIAVVFHDSDAEFIVTAVNAYASQKAEIERLREAMEKIDAIRNSIIGYQNVGWSAHIYPLVAALEDAGFHGEGYEKSRELAKTQVDAILALTEENDRLRSALSEALNGKE